MWDKFSMINYSRLGSKARKGELNSELIKFIKKEKAFRVFLKDIEGI